MILLVVVVAVAIVVVACISCRLFKMKIMRAIRAVVGFSRCQNVGIVFELNQASQIMTRNVSVSCYAVKFGEFSRSR